MQDLGDARAAVAGLYGRGMRFGTQTTRALLDRLGCPDEKLKIIHIAGSNGKGSVAEYMTRILVCAGKRTGTFVSPAVYDESEMCRVDAAALSEEKSDGYLRRALQAAEGLCATAFEVQTAAALCAFAGEGCAYAVIECGLGGTYDATNAVLKKEIALIASVSLEHTDVLGGTLEQICAHKAGIINGCPALVSAYQTDGARACFKKMGLTFAGGTVEDVRDTPEGQIFLYGGKPFETHMTGCAQPYNAALAIEAARLLGIGEDAVYAGVKEAKLPGRQEMIQRGGRVYVLDGAHNPASFVPLAALLRGRFVGKRAELIYGCLSDKDADGSLRALEGLAARVFAVSPPSPRAMAREKILAAARRHFVCVLPSDGVGQALAAAEGDVVVVCGSFTLLKEAKNWIERG